MAFNGSGTFNRIYNWVNDKANGIKITASRMDGEFDGIATGLSSCITKDGQTTITANIPFSNYKITGIGAGTARTDVINVGQVQDNQFLYWGTTGGSADAYTLTPSPTITAYATTQQFTAKISATNTTTTPYLQISGIANPTTTAVIKKLNASKAEIAVEASDLLIDGIYHFQRNSANDAWIVLNPEKPYINLTNGTSATTTTPITIANNATDANNDIDFGAGVMNFTNGSGLALATALTKQLDASWSAGTNQGGLFTGTKANSTWYHCFAIWNPTTQTYDAGFDTSITASNKPSGYTNYEYRGSILTDGSGNIRAFTQNKRNFTFATVINSINGASQTAGSETLRTIASPLGIKTRVWGSVLGVASSAGSAHLKAYDADITSSTIASNDGQVYISNGVTVGVGYFEAITNTSSQIKTNLVNTSGTPSIACSITISGYENLALTNF